MIRPSSTEATSEQRQQIADLHARGLTARQIAAIAGISTQRVYQQLKHLDLRPNPPKRAK